MKYEPVFGDQSLFDGAPSGGFYMATEDGGVQYLSRGPLNGDRCKYIDGYLIAERRIIAEPKRWTLEDKRAGRLPEVGSEVILRVNGEIATVNAKNKNIVCLTFSDGGLSPFNVERIDPIETPEEKAKREEDEFVSLVEFEYNKMPNEVSFRAGIRAAYRKLKGGE